MRLHEWGTGQRRGNDNSRSPAGDDHKKGSLNSNDNSKNNDNSKSRSSAFGEG